MIRLIACLILFAIFPPLGLAAFALLAVVTLRAKAKSHAQGTTLIQRRQWERDYQQWLAAQPA